MPQLLEEKNFEFPKYYIVNTPPPPRKFRALLENRDETPRVCVGGVTPSISSGIPIQFSRANFENI